MNVSKEIERRRLPCGAATIGIENVCRRRLHDRYDLLLDRLTREIHPEGEDLEKALLIQQGKRKADAKMEVDKYKEKLLMGNSKLLQDPSGKIKKR